MPLRFRPRYWNATHGDGVDGVDGSGSDVASGSPFGVEVAPTPVRAPKLLAWNEPLADTLGLGPDERADDAIVAAFAGNNVEAALPGARPMALVYAGHQFGSFVPRLGDGRAILLGEVDDDVGGHFDLQLKGAGPTPFSRGGDGRAAIGPVLREFLLSEAMHALGVPTTQALVAVATGESVFREVPLHGAVVTRVARSHLRVGTFEYFANRGDVDALHALVAHAVGRHHDSARDSENQALGLLDAVVDTQAKLIARWMGVGFVHGVMNTDNCSIAGDTIDYGPAAFLDGYDPGRTFSFIDRQGRYAYGRQAQMAMWNIMRLGECLVPVVAANKRGAAPDAKDIAVAEREVEQVLARFPRAFAHENERRFRAKLGLDVVSGEDIAGGDDLALIESLLTEMADTKADFTATFRALADVVDGVDVEAALTPALAPSTASTASAAPLFDWARRYRERVLKQVGAGAPLRQVSTSMRLANPARIPRNLQVEAALVAAATGDLGPFSSLRQALKTPFVDDDSDDARLLARAAGAEQWRYRTFCGT